MKPRRPTIVKGLTVEADGVWGAGQGRPADGILNSPSLMTTIAWLREGDSVTVGVKVWVPGQPRFCGSISSRSNLNIGLN